MSGSANFKPYEGEQEYIFVSYSHKDKGGVFPIIERLNAEGFRIWYDDIEWGREWRSEIVQHIEACSAFISFQSKSYSQKSTYCPQEIYHADHNNKEILYIFLEALKGKEITEGIKNPHSDTQSAFLFQYKDNELEEFFDRLIHTPLIQSCRSSGRNTNNITNYTNALRRWRKAGKVKRMLKYAGITTVISALFFCGHQYAVYQVTPSDYITAGQWNVFGLAANGTPKRIRQALNSGVNFNIIGEDGDTPLHKAAAANPNPDSIELLLSLGLDVNARGTDRFTPLMRAAENPNPETVRVLLRNGADVNIYTGGESALSIAAENHNDNPETVKLLLEAYSKSEREDLLTGETRFLRLPFLKHINTAFGSYENPYYFWRGNILPDKFKLTILGVAVLAGNHKVVQYLLDAGCDVDAENYDGITTLMIAAALSDSDETVRIISRAVKYVNACDRFGQTALKEAVLVGSVEMVKILIAAGANINAKDTDGETILMSACQRTYRTNEKELAEIIMLLLNAGADINAEGGNYVDEDGRHAPMRAADFAVENKYLKNNQDVIRLLTPHTKSDNS